MNNTLPTAPPITLHPSFTSAGCRGAIVVAEARSADEPVLTRRCVVMKVADFTTEKYLEAQKQNAAAVLILLPKNISSLPQESIQVRMEEEAVLGGALFCWFHLTLLCLPLPLPQSFMVSEREALQKETLMPVYVAPEDDQLLCMYEEVKQAAATRTSSIFVRGERKERRPLTSPGHQGQR